MPFYFLRASTQIINTICEQFQDIFTNLFIIRTAFHCRKGDCHNTFLWNLLPNCKVLNINTPRKQKQPKETNWKQKFQKPKNENICLTSVNTEMNGNFHFLSFGVVSWRRKIEGKTMLLKMKTLAKMRIC